MQTRWVPRESGYLSFGYVTMPTRYAVRSTYCKAEKLHEICSEARWRQAHFDIVLKIEHTLKPQMRLRSLL